MGAGPGGAQAPDEETLQVGFTQYIPVAAGPGNHAAQQTPFEAVSARDARRGQFATQGVLYGDVWKTERIEMTYDTGCDKQELQWTQPIRADVSYTQQFERALGYIAVTKFGFIALQHALSLMKIKVRKQSNSKPKRQKRFQVTHSSYLQMEMVDTFEGGKITVFAHYLLNNNETPFRVVLDPPIGNLSAVLAVQINAIVGRHFQSLPDSYDYSSSMQPQQPPAPHVNSQQEHLRAFHKAYSDRAARAGQDLHELLGSYLHVKTHFRLMWDICDQANHFRDEEEAGVDARLDRDQPGGRYAGQGASDPSNSVRFENLQYKTQVSGGSSARTIPPLSCHFEYVVTDKQDKLIMLKHSQEVREIVLTISYRNLFIVTAYVSADGKTIYLQDRAVKYNDPMGGA